MLELKIAKPCDQSWTAMKGDERVRHCGRCDHDVYNISEMTEAEVEDLVVRTEGKFCARLYRRSDNRVMTKDCPKGVAATRRRGVLALAAAGASMVCALSFARGEEPLTQTVRPTPAQKVRKGKAVPVKVVKPIVLPQATLGAPMMPKTLPGHVGVIPKRKKS